MQIIEFGALQKSSFQQLLNRYSSAKKVIVVDENTHDNCLEFLITAFEDLTDAEVLLLPAGEENKVMEVCFQVWEALSEYEISRKDLVINLGGGLVTDMGGFIASIYKRGVAFVNIPTSLLGMVDAAVGGKTGIDLGPFKNQLGTFTFPIATYVDTGFLQTLPEEEIWNGYAEMIKHALIKDTNLWKYLKEVNSSEDLQQFELIKKSTEIKLSIVESDPVEKGERKLLNFGHTIGHALEGFFLQNEEPIAHGHAVAIGILLESRLSYQLGHLSISELREIELVVSNYQQISFEVDDIPSIIQIMKNDKKNADGKIFGVLIEKIGECKYDFAFEEEEINQVLSEYIA